MPTRTDEVLLKLEVERLRQAYETDPNEETKAAYARALQRLSEMLLEKSSRRLAKRRERLQRERSPRDTPE